MELFWHYTTAEKWKRIKKTAELRPTDVLIDKGERPAVWFTAATFWEPTAEKGVHDPTSPTGTRILTMLEMHERVGLVRVGVGAEAAPHNWTAFRKQSGCSRTMVNRLAKIAKAKGSNLQLWRVSFEAVPRSLWEAVERFDGEAWVNLGT